MSKKILITSDFHIESGIYTDICIDYLDYITDYCLQNKIENIFIAGDIFEKSSKIKNEAFIPLFFKFMAIKDFGIHLNFILGNHDIFNVDNDSLVETFFPFGNVSKETEYLTLFEREFTFLPYTKDPYDIPAKGDVLITHLSIADFTFDNKYHVNEKKGFPINLFENYNIVFTGHFHRPQNKKNIVYLGSPYQMNFGEAGQQKGFIVFDAETGDWKREWYFGAPKYIKIKASEFDKINVKNSFVQVEVEEKLENYVQLKHILYDKGALDVSPYFIENENEIKIKEDEKIDLNNNIKTMMEEYILNNITVDNIDNNKLLDIFHQIIEI